MEGGEYQTARDCKRFQLPIGTGIDLELGIIIFNNLILLCKMSNVDDNEPIRAERATVRFFDGLEVDGYRMPNGEFRVGLTGASLVLGYGENWLSRRARSEIAALLAQLRIEAVWGFLCL